MFPLSIESGSPESILREEVNFTTVCGPWSASKNCNLEYLIWIKTSRVENFPEDSFYVSHDNFNVASSKLKHFSCNSKKGDRARAPLVRECGPWSAKSCKQHEKDLWILIISVGEWKFYQYFIYSFLSLMYLSYSLVGKSWVWNNMFYFSDNSLPHKSQAQSKIITRLQAYMYSRYIREVNLVHKHV